MVRAIAGFDWDDGNLAKCRKHGVSAEEIEFLFEAGPQIAPDIKHSGASKAHSLRSVTAQWGEQCS